jgi:hypothetical protein
VVVSEGKQENMAIASDSPPWYILDVLLVTFLLLHAGFPGLGMPFVWHLAGLRNDLSLVFGGVLGWGMLLPIAGIVLIVVVARMALTWPKRVASLRRTQMLRCLVVAGLAVEVALYCTGLGPSSLKAFTRGFRQYAQANVDVPAIRAWRHAADPNLCPGELPRIDWPEAIARVEPSHVWLSLDKAGRPTIRLSWLIWGDNWGVEIGPEDMEIPATQWRTPRTSYGGRISYEQGEYRLPLAPGAYVWRRIG